MSTLVLASGSPRRAALLQQLGLAFDVVSTDIDERPAPRETARHYVRRMSLEKLAAARSAPGTGTAVVLAADTEVVVDGRIMGKPSDQADCVAMLGALSGRSHQVMTGVSVASGARVDTFVVETIVTFRRLMNREYKDYWATGEPRDKAGGYGIQGIGAIFVKKIEGSYSNVVGLPLMEVARALKRHGIDCLSA